jgi:glutamine synthetase
LQEDTDRNRTSPFAYTGNKFEFRAVGSSQNVCFPMAVIAATMAESIKYVSERLDSGVPLEKIIIELREETQAIRFNGNGYSE